MLKKIGNVLFWVLMIILVLVIANNFYNKYKSNANIDSKLEELPKATPSAAEKEDEKADPIAPDFTLKDIQGNTVKLSDYKGKVVFLNFWASWCPPCKSEIPDFNKASEELNKGSDAVILAINATNGYNGETPDRVKKFVKDNNITMKVLLDEKDDASMLYGVSSLPTTFVIRKDGTVYGYQVGPMSHKKIMELVNELK